MVARVALNINNMHQDRDETIRSFGARLRGQANVCKYSIECPSCHTDVSYTEAILRDALSRDIDDSEIQLDLLGHTNQDISLEEIFRFVEAKEAGKRSASRLLSSQGADSIRSSYRRIRKEAVVDQHYNKGDDKSVLCSYCGKKGHGEKSTSRHRMDVCPAYNHICRHCTIAHHFESICRGRNKPKLERSRKPTGYENEGAIFNTLCAARASSNPARGHRKTLTLDHHLHDQLCNTWRKRPSRPQPFLNLTVRIVDDDYYDLGFLPIINANHTPINLPVMADTGCQSCLAGFGCIQRLELTKKDLIPVKMQMHAANNKSINILGAIIIRISGKNDKDEALETRQVTYVTDNSDKLFLSKGACIDLGIISEHFPTIGEAAADQIEATYIDTTPPSIKECNCPKRCLPPPLPTELPFPATDVNREKLQLFLLDYYGPSTFNVCEYQPLATYGRSTPQTQHRPRCQTSSISYSYPSPNSLAGGCEGWT